MAMLPILDIESPELRVTCSAVKFLPEDFEETLADMFETMIHHRGVGLSAPQIGIHKRFFMYTLDLQSTDFATVINPQIVSRSGSSIAEEGCLSYEGYTAQVNRAFQILVRYQNEQFQKVERTIEGWEARIFQHEFDHLEGILFVDRMEDGTLHSLAERQATNVAEAERLELPQSAAVESPASI